MFRRGILEVHSEYDGGFAEDIVAVFRVDRTPIETWLDHQRSSQDKDDESSYIPSAFSESVLTTIFLSSSLHRFIIVSTESEYTTDLT
jgi:hypothetical protein